MIMMALIRSLVISSAFDLEHQWLLRKFYKGITTGHATCRFEQTLDYQIEFCTPKSRIIFTVSLSFSTIRIYAQSNMSTFLIQFNRVGGKH